MPHPIQFSIPECKIIKDEDVPEKTVAFANCMPTFYAQYIYDDETEYYRGYEIAYFGITKKKGGVDCMRHYEILARKCMPYFEGLEQCPENTMVLFPKKQVLEAMSLPGVDFQNKTIDFTIFNKARYYELLEEVFEYTKKHLTTRAMARYILDTIGYQEGEHVLFMSNQTIPDYLRCLTLIGLKENIGKLCVDVPRIPHIYKSCQGVKGLYGRGMSYTCILDDEIDEGIIRSPQPLSKYKHIIYGSVHRGLVLYQPIIDNELFPVEHIWFLCGEDCHGIDTHGNNTPSCTTYGANLFLREQ